MLCQRFLWRSVRRIFLVALSILSVSTLYITLSHHRRLFTSTPISADSLASNGNAEILASLQRQTGQACVHPKLMLWHPALAPYFKDVPPLTCSKVEENWVYSENGTFRMSSKARQTHGDVLCEFIPYLRGNDDFAVGYGNPVKPVNNGDPMPADFGEVKCVGNSGKVYKNIVAGISATDRLKARKPDFKERNATGLNVLMFGFDSTSRMTWMRNLPKSHDYFVNTLGGVVMEGYNIVGDGTPQALLPILTGKTEPELPEARRGFAGAKNVDGHPWIFKELKNMGYLTQWGEDGASAGTFTYRMLGFKEQPVDHYFRPFYIRAEQQYGAHEPFCLGSLPRHRNMLNWVKDFFTVYPNQPKFSFLFHSEFTHGGYSQVRVVDEDLKTFLKELNEGGDLDNTLLILMADHGARFQDLRQTVQGKYEERMPYFSFRFPPKFEKEHPELMKNLRTNVHRLTTPFDVHATFEDLLNMTSPLKGDVRNRGISVLKEIPRDRSCIDAGIEAHWCACLNWKSVDINLSDVKHAANHLLKVINDMTGPERAMCDELQIKNITSAVIYSPNEKVLKFRESKDIHGRLADLSDNMKVSDVLYQITIETIPGNGKFEATIKHSLKDNVFLASGRDISRINRYGNHPHCVQAKLPHLRPYCYCKVQLQ